MTVQDIRTPPPQMSDARLKELIRLETPGLLERAIRLSKEADNDSVKLGAIKLLLGKVLADLKSQDFTDSEGKSLIEKIIIVKAGDGQAGEVKQVAG